MPILASVRAHPIRTAALVGGVAGLANVLAGEIHALLHHDRKAAVMMLWPSSSYNLGVNEPRIAETLLILFIEIAANVVVDALLLAAPVALLVLIRRLFMRPSH
jgi:hypothetical protein